MKSQILVSRGVASIRIPTVTVWPTSPTYFDLASITLKGVGYVIRYWVSQIPDFIIEGAGSGDLEMTERHDILTLDPGVLPTLTGNLDKMSRQIGAWKNSGARVVVIPIPSKLSIERERFPAKLPPCQVWSRCNAPQVESAQTNYAEVVLRVPEALDLFAVYRSQYLQGLDPYLPDESHWSSLGIGLAARATLARLGVNPLPEMTEADAFEDFHFAKQMLQLPDWYLNRHAGSARHREPTYRFAVLSKPSTMRGSDLRANRLVILGTSFCLRLGHTKYGLSNLLAENLQAGLKTYCGTGNGLWGAIGQMELAGESVRGGDIVVWEVPMYSLVSRETTGRV